MHHALGVQPAWTWIITGGCFCKPRFQRGRSQGFLLQLREQVVVVVVVVVGSEINNCYFFFKISTPFHQAMQAVCFGV